MRKLWLSVAWLALAAGGASAQTAPERVRVELQSGVFFVGDLADATFQLDTSPFGGILIQRTGGTLDVDPAFSYGLRTSYRLASRFQLVGSWLHSEGRYRVTFPAEASDEGSFDLEALLLAGFDFQSGPDGARVESAMSLAKTDCYSVGLEYEIPMRHRSFFPYFTAGAGKFIQRSDGNVIALEFEGDVPSSIQIAELAGISPLAGSGISEFAIDSNDWLLVLGTGVRASLSSRWAVHLTVQDQIRLGADLTYIDESSTPPPDASVFRLYQTTFEGKEGTIHNYGVQVVVAYAAWPFGAPR